MPWLVLVCHTSTGDHLIALYATSGVFLLVALGAVNFLFAWDEALSSNRCLAHDATEALFVPLPCLVFHLLGTSPEDFTATIATGSELVIVATTAVDAVGFRAELFVDEGFAAVGAQEASLVPMLLLVGQVLGIDANGLVALLAGIGEDGLVAGYAIGMVLTKDITLAGETLVALPAAEVLTMPVLVHGLCVFTALVSIGTLRFGDGNFGTVITVRRTLGGLFHFLGLLLRNGEVSIIVDVSHRNKLALGYRPKGLVN